MLIPIPLPSPPVLDGSFCSSKEGRFEFEAPKAMIPDNVKRKVCAGWKEFRLFEASSERERAEMKEMRKMEKRDSDDDEDDESGDDESDEKEDEDDSEAFSRTSK
ncbi:uncharacterized protein MONOS_7354 [Monocercomonoides exilis]|uniref:uncharacterized protein n=1 Tax=Monocercomonoides exilis TaxID=2049356 RepID=UPI003559F255|nr:hypothetical protein MONOS_7354 [Monocercomonoides exilis]|eukprot:MONOS_7354.1-p1 / transcript=MONOS_7354.1 / gene=MONOS_7354 / organism=Monocercomonoides_exilis_PA203 / gene_product=unspecified product / transcript_product=unspecified product / location=Mono_scaffold00249:44288-44602(-) / protein_length=105 / sequence_SO=supercontig / SO=protein_coding / is_pseudo=false